MASLTSASSRGFANPASQLPATGPAAAPCVAHCPGTARFGSASGWNSSGFGGGLSAHAPSVAIIASASVVVRVLMASVQLQHEVIRVGADPQDDHAQDVNGFGAVAVHGGAARGAGSGHDLAVPFVDVELDDEAVR